MSFDIEKFAEELAEKHPELISNGSSGDVDVFETDEFERALVSECPELAEQICKLDRQTAEEEKGNTVSKKQQTRDRQERLESMMTDGRSLYEKQKTFHDRMLESEGPMKMLAAAVKSRSRVEVRTRGAVRIDRILVGFPTTFDEHFNMMLDDVTETVLRGRKSHREVGERNRMQALLPDFLLWKEGGEWPIPVGKNRLCEHRKQRSCFVKGDSIVLIRTIPKVIS